MAELITIPARQAERFFFWSAPVQDSEFTAEDPLALDYIAQQVGLFLLPTLTTRSSRAQAYAMVLYGLHLAQRALDQYGLEDDDDTRRALFERWERFWALATLESRDGRLERGDPDAMRGVRGAVRAWFPGEKPLPRDYPLISRQLELGALGAYLAPLRASSLVVPGTLRVSAAADEIIAAFWGEPDENTRTGWYDEYAMLALDPAQTRIPRSHRNLTLRRVGERSRLSCLTGRENQQRRLYAALLHGVRDRTGTTRPIADLVEASSVDRVVGTRDILDGAVAGRWGELDAALVELLVLGRRFGEVMHTTLQLFDRVYVSLSSAGWQAQRSDMAREALPAERLKAFREASEALLAAPQVARLRGLPAHGASFLRFLEEARTTSPDQVIELLLAYHRRVQRDRRRGDAWIRDDSGRLTLLLTSYTARPEADRCPGLRLGVVRQLLVDCGRLSSTHLAATAEVES
jgi:hypothetical protein